MLPTRGALFGWLFFDLELVVAFLENFLDVRLERNNPVAQQDHLALNRLIAPAQQQRL
jgi:hypothetical protein